MGESPIKVIRTFNKDYLKILSNVVIVPLKPVPEFQYKFVRKDKEFASKLGNFFEEYHQGKGPPTFKIMHVEDEVISLKWKDEVIYRFYLNEFDGPEKYLLIKLKDDEKKIQ